MAKASNTQRNAQPKGRYVYGWFNDESPYPFYIGKGVDGRAVQKHRLAPGRSAYCETIKATSRNFKSVIIRDGLTNEGSMLLESSLIGFFSSLGGCVGNQVSPLKRQELPPLTLQEVKADMQADPDRPKSVTTSPVIQPASPLLLKIVEVIETHEEQGGLPVNAQKVVYLLDECGFEPLPTASNVYDLMKENSLLPDQPRPNVTFIPESVVAKHSKDPADSKQLEQKDSGKCVARTSWFDGTRTRPVHLGTFANKPTAAVALKAAKEVRANGGTQKQMKAAAKAAAEGGAE